MSFFAELNRRNVIRVGITYAVITWLIMQFSDVVLNNIKSPDWVFQVIMLALAIAQASNEAEPSIAVLPFVNMSTDPEPGILQDSPAISVATATENLDAYDIYLKARGLFLTRQQLEESIALYERAVELDPGNATNYFLYDDPAVAKRLTQLDREFA